MPSMTPSPGNGRRSGNAASPEAGPRSWRVRQLGTPREALRLEARTAWPPGPGEARVEVGAVGLNFPDLLLCAGRYQERPPLPFSPGFEAAGVVAEAGDGTVLTPGQPVVVVPELPNGALQQSITVPAAQLYPVPEPMPVTAAAALHIAYQTAYVALHHRAGLRAGDTVLVTGAAGGVGSAAVQLGRAAGCPVIAAVTGPAKAAACRRMGASLVIDLAAGPDPVTRVRAETGGRGADVIIDVVGGDTFGWARRCVAFEGRIVLVGFTGGAIGQVPANHVLLRNYSVLGLHLAVYRRENPALLRTVHDTLVRMCGDGAISPLIYRELPFDQAPAGLDLLSGREVIGRVVLRC
ncbi:MAG: NADPH:quinone oxidoreductase family protein [Streptosporangiaceae bacterium]